jgi:tRNA/tmRNA/rRNA uracil-C5-methylase (TrmA/RlmC/RlmD family)
VVRFVRTRAKFRVRENQGIIRIEGTDPQQGTVPFERVLWILPAWARPIAEDVAAYREEHKHDFPFDGFELQLTHGQQQAHALLSVKKTFSINFEDCAEDLWTAIPKLKGVAIPSQRIELGDVCLDHRLLGKHFLAHYDSFFQSNLSLTPELLDRLVSEAEAMDFVNIVDLYCGVGLLSLSLAKKETPIVGIESEKKSVDCAMKNALRLCLNSTTFIHSKVEIFLKRAEFHPGDLVIINPPRAGCDSSVIKSVAEQRPSHILLVSCCLETQVRDLELWKDEGYEAASISAFDMFPFTPFIETITRLTSYQ